MPVAALSSRKAPTTTVSPEAATSQPNRSSVPVFEALSEACGLQSVPTRTKTYAAPESGRLLSAILPFTPVAALSSRHAPTMTVSPDTATVDPKLVGHACI